MERVCAERIIERLKLEYSGRVIIEPFFWEHEPMRATASFNDPENIPLTADFNVVICILWSRLGTMLSKKFRRPNGEQYPSGTAFEIETAVNSYLERQSPDILVYRRTQEVAMPVNDPVESAKRGRQLSALNDFIQRWFFDEDASFKAAINEYRALGQFEAKLEKPLRALIHGYIAKNPADSPVVMPAPSYHGENPFRGLQAYDFEDAKIFFGRSQAIEDVLTTMRNQAAAGRAFTLVHGASGSGKSSLLRAGVIPTMTHLSCVVEGVACWGVATLTPGSTNDSLLEALAAALQGARSLPTLRRDTGDVKALALRLEQNPEGMVPSINSALVLTAQEVQSREALPDLPPTKLVLLVDQIEQIFSDDRRFPREQRKAFAAALNVLARSGIVWVVATTRSDQLGRLTDDLPELAELSQGGQYALLAPTEADMDLMIRMPARAAGVAFEEDPVTGVRLESRLLAEARHAPDGLPLLSFVLRELYARRELVGGVPTMTHACLDELGGLEGAVKSRAEEIYAHYLKNHPAVQNPLKHLARTLVTLGRDKDEPALRRITPLAIFTGAKAELGDLIAALVEGRLLTKTAGVDKQPVIFVTHEALFRKWKDLADAIALNRTFLVLRSRAATSAMDWLERKRARDFLWDRGARLKEAQELLADLDDLDSVEQAFVKASVASAQRRRTQRFIWAAATVAVLGTGAALAMRHLQSVDQTLTDNLAKLSEKEDLKKQLDLAVAALTERAWPKLATPSSGQEQIPEDEEFSEDEEDGNFPSSPTANFPALDVLEISRRLQKLDPDYPRAFAAEVLARIYDDSGLMNKEKQQAEIQRLFGEWSRHGLPKNEVLDLEAQWQWKNGNQATAITTWTSYLRTPGLEDEIKRRLLDRISSYYVEKEMWTEVENIINTSWAWEDHVLAKIRRAKARLRLFKLDLAEKDFEEAKLAAPDLPEVLELGPPLARLLTHRKALATASENLSDSRGKSVPELWLARARILLTAEQYPEALSDLDMANKLTNGRSTAIDFIRVASLIRGGRSVPAGSKIISLKSFYFNSQQWEEWMARSWTNLMNQFIADKVLMADANNAAVLLQRSSGWFQFAQGNLGLADAEAALKIEPDNHLAHYWRAKHLLRLGRFEDALKEATAMQALKTKYIDHIEIKAEAEFGLGQAEAAVRTITEIVQRLPRPYYHELRARYLRKLGKEAEAELDDQAAMKLRN